LDLDIAARAFTETTVEPIAKVFHRLILLYSSISNIDVVIKPTTVMVKVKFEVAQVKVKALWH
jgi:hypothetical protein